MKRIFVFFWKIILPEEITRSIFRILSKKVCGHLKVFNRILYFWTTIFPMDWVGKRQNIFCKNMRIANWILSAPISTAAPYWQSSPLSKYGRNQLVWMSWIIIFPDITSSVHRNIGSYSYVFSIPLSCTDRGELGYFFKTETLPSVSWNILAFYWR